MLFKKKGQTTIEYTTIAAIVVASILIMGPYMIRSINAFFKSLDDEVNDSFMEELF